MEVTGDSLDELMAGLYPALLRSELRNTGTRGDTLEILGVTLRLTNPRARLSRSENRGKLFSALGELLWYLSGSDRLDFIRKYIPQYDADATHGVIHGAYGPRLFRMRGKIDQFHSICDLLSRRPGSRRAVIQLFNAEDIASNHKEIPCTTTLQFILRNRKLHLSATLRSNDGYLGLPHDVFCFTMLQEMMACRLGVQLRCDIQPGYYYQYVGSMHIYKDHCKHIKRYLDEGHQRIFEMPPMPYCDPFTIVPSLLNAEKRLRRGENFLASNVTPEGYWADLIRLLQVFWNSDDDQLMDQLTNDLCSPIFLPYVDGRRGARPPTLCQCTSTSLRGVFRQLFQRSSNHRNGERF